jgi:ABC-2 type transport system ATP-binding protein
MLELNEISKSYNHVQVVRQVSFVARPGEILGYLGPNGAGKSTTIKMLAGLVEPDSGRILLDGQWIRKDILSYKKRIGYIPEQAEIYPQLSGKEYLQLVGRLRLMPEKKLEEKIDYLMGQLGLAGDMHQPLENYSKGMRQKVLVIAAVLHNPDVLLLDEPLSGLDVSTILVFKEILRAFVGLGKVIIFSSHLIDVVEHICDRVIILDRGAILADDSIGRLREMMHLPSLESVFKELIQYEDLEQKARNIVAAIGCP